jgi:hypothetical protein
MVMPARSFAKIKKVERFLTWHVSEQATPRWRVARLSSALGTSDRALLVLLRRHGRLDLLKQLRRPSGNYDKVDKSWMDAENELWIRGK